MRRVDEKCLGYERQTQTRTSLIGYEKFGSGQGKSPTNSSGIGPRMGPARPVEPHIRGKPPGRTCRPAVYIVCNSVSKSDETSRRIPWPCGIFA